MEPNIYLTAVKDQINSEYFEWIDNKICKIKGEDMKILYFEPMLTFR
jgi:hypothetical protein